MEDDNKLVEERREKLKALRAAGTAYPNDFRKKDWANELLQVHGQKTKEDLEKAGARASVAGRMMLKRVMGKASFATLQDGSGRMQVYISNDVTGEKDHDAFKHWDLGDIVAVEGRLFKTMKGELTVHAEKVRLLAKALRPLPEKFHGLTDQEMRYRQRYVDLVMNPQVREVFLTRTRVVQSIREALVAEGYLEVETPMMQPIPGGATARPFVTHHNALSTDLYLRIAPELYLKRLIVGGFPRVFEINRNFRNEGISTIHNPEFTMLEFYVAYADYTDLIALTEELFTRLAKDVLGTTTLEYQGQSINLASPWRRWSWRQALLEVNQLDQTILSDRNVALAAAKKLGVEVEKDAALVDILNEMFEETVELQLIQPTFITDYPIELSPLARRKDSDPSLTDRFELYIGGREIANAFSELNDPLDQRQRFEAQDAKRAAGDVEAHYLDEDFLRALEYAMPPTAGEGIGIDRLVMLFTNQASIRDVILFPQLRPEK